MRPPTTRVIGPARPAVCGRRSSSFKSCTMVMGDAGWRYYDHGYVTWDDIEEWMKEVARCEAESPPPPKWIAVPQWFTDALQEEADAQT